MPASSCRSHRGHGPLLRSHMVPDALSRASSPTRRHAAAVLLAALAVLVMLLSSRQMSDLRSALPPLSRAMSWLEGLPVPMDMDHVAFFALVALAMRFVLPQARWLRLLLALGLLAVCTELLQFASDGRTPKLQDARDDVMGAGIGLLSGALLLRLFSSRRLRRDDKFASIAGMARDANGTDALHAVLASVLLRREASALADVVARHGVDAVLAACEREGVVSLVHARLSESAALHPAAAELMQPLALRARQCAARSMLCMAETRRIQQALADTEIPALWLKGIALGQWLYPHAYLRDIADVDLLLPDHASTLRAAEVLAPLGYALPNPHIAGDLVVHELLAWSERMRLELDLHWDLSNDALFAGRLAWDELWAAAQTLPVLGDAARGLSPMHAFLHACMHRALNHLTRRENRLRWLYDIHLLWESLSPAVQAATVELAKDRRLAGSVSDALTASSASFDTALDSRVFDDLREAASREPLQVNRLRSWACFQSATLEELSGRRKLRWLRQLLFPDLAHLRARYGADGAGWLRILLRRLLDGIARLRGYTGT